MAKTKHALKREIKEIDAILADLGPLRTQEDLGSLPTQEEMPGHLARADSGRKAEVFLPESETNQNTFESSGHASHVHKLLVEYAARMKEGWRLYRPLPAAVPFHACTERRVILEGTNRAGKTLTAAAEIAMTLLGQEKIKQLPAQNGRMVAVARDGDHIGQTMWRKLYLPGAYQVVPDEITGAWRSVRPNPADPRTIDPIDEDRRELWRPAPPLLPPRMIKDIGWEARNLNIPSVVVMANGWECLWRSSRSDPDRGMDVWRIWFDEEIAREAWYSEMVARLIDHNGYLLWSATPQQGGDHFNDLLDMVDEGRPGIAGFQLLIVDNPYLPQAAKDQFHRDLEPYPEELAVRFYGKRASHGLRVYPNYNPSGIHGVEAFPIPDEWTRYLAIDPGWQLCATLFAAVPPDESCIHFYDQLYLDNATADSWGASVADKLRGQPLCEAFIFDMQMGRQVHPGSGLSIAQHYSDALEKHGVKSRTTGFGFTPGSSDITGRTEALRGWLRAGGDGTPFLRVHRGMVNDLDREMKFQTFRPEKIDKRVDRKNHLVYCAEALAAFSPYYHVPERPKPAEDPVLASLKRKKKLARMIEAAEHESAAFNFAVSTNYFS